MACISINTELLRLHSYCRPLTMRYFRCGFICLLFKVWVFLLRHFCVSNSFNSVKITELPPVKERVANSACHLWFCCLLRYVCPSFPEMFGISFGFWFGQFLRYLNYFNFKPPPPPPPPPPPRVILPNLSERIFWLFSSRKCPWNLWPTLQAYLFLFVVSFVQNCYFLPFKS